MLMRSYVLYKFSDGTLTRLLSSLEDITKSIGMEYLPKRRWSTLEKKRAHLKIKDINKLLKERRMMRSLEKFVGGRLYGLTSDCCKEQYDLVILCSYLKEHAEYDESNTYVLERFNTTVGNPVKNILLKLNLSDHRSILMDSKEYLKMVMERQSVKVKDIQERCIIKAFQDYQIKKGMSMSVQKSQVHEMANCSYAGHAGCLDTRKSTSGGIQFLSDKYKRRCYSLIPAKSDSLPHAHAQTTKTYYKHQDSRIKKAQELKTKTSANSDIQDLPLRYQVYQRRLLERFQEDAKYEHVGQNTRS
ncbi:hypothetical protein Tco_0261690 [Tanacetum coccineum]